MTEETLPLDVPPSTVEEAIAQVQEMTEPRAGERWLPTLAGLAYLMAQEANTGFERDVAGMLKDVADGHRSRNGDCFSCGFGDTPWPCSDWMNAYEVAVSWLMDRAGLGEVVS